MSVSCRTKGIPVYTYSEAASDTAEPTEELVALADDNLVHFYLAIIPELERQVRVI